MIGENIKMLRIEKGMTLKGLADKLFVSEQAVTRWENGEVELSMTTISRIARIFNLSIEELLHYETLSKEKQDDIHDDSVNKTIFKPLLGVCEKCNAPIYDENNLNSIKLQNGKSSLFFCNLCYQSIKDNDNLIEKENKKRIRNKTIKIACLVSISYFLIISLIGIISKNYRLIFANIFPAIVVYFFVSCIIIDNNIIKKIVFDGFKYIFKELPILIYEINDNNNFALKIVKNFLLIIEFFISLVISVLLFLIALIGSIVIFPILIINNIYN